MNLNANIYKIFTAVLVCLLIGFLSSLAIQNSLHNWLKIIQKPSFLVPDLIYTSLWMFNFALMGIAAGIVWSRGLHHVWVKTAMYHFGFQLLLNAAWFIVFYELKLPFVGFLLITTLFIFLLFTIKWFKVVNNMAAYLLVPYTLWIGYTAIVNFEIWRLN